MGRLNGNDWQGNPWQQFIGGQEVVCSVFGCGKRMTPQEQLFGNECFKHKLEKMASTLRSVQPGDKYWSLVGTEVTFRGNLWTLGGCLSHEEGEKAVVRDVRIIPGHNYRPIPDIWIEERINAIRIEGVNGTEFYPEIFVELEEIATKQKARM